MFTILKDCHADCDSKMEPPKFVICHHSTSLRYLSIRIKPVDKSQFACLRVKRVKGHVQWTEGQEGASRLPRHRAIW